MILLIVYANLFPFYFSFFHISFLHFLLLLLGISILLSLLIPYWGLSIWTHNSFFFYWIFFYFLFPIKKFSIKMEVKRYLNIKIEENWELKKKPNVFFPVEMIDWLTCVNFQYFKTFLLLIICHLFYVLGNFPTLSFIYLIQSSELFILFFRHCTDYF